jgi:hypothetical protein
MGSPQKHFPLSKLKKLSKKRIGDLRDELKRQINKDPIMRKLIPAHKEMSKRLVKEVRKKFPELR